MSAVSHRRTQHQALEAELGEIRDLAQSRFSPGTLTKTEMFEHERNTLVRTRVITDATFVEECLTLLIMHYLFRGIREWERLRYFGRRKRFQILYSDIIGRLAAQERLRILEREKLLPREVVNSARRVLTLRNTFAHVFTIDYTMARRIQYKGRPLTNSAVFRDYVSETDALCRSLARRVMRGWARDERNRAARPGGGAARDS